MTVKLTLTKLMQPSSGLLKDDNHDLLERFDFFVANEHVVLVNNGEIVQEKRANQYFYTLTRDVESKESIVFSSEGPAKNPWSNENLLIQIFGEVRKDDSSVEQISEWNYNQWKITDEVTYGDYTVKDVDVSSLSQLDTNRYSILAKITIQDGNGIVFGDDYIISRSGYILLSLGLTREGPQEIDLVAGNELQDGAIILHKIETVA